MGFVNHKRGDWWNGGFFTIKNKLTGLPLNLTGITAKSDFKTHENGEIYFSFDTANGTLTIPIPTDGKIYYKARKMDVPANRYIFDLELTDALGRPTTYVTSEWIITQDITNGSI